MFSCYFCSCCEYNSDSEEKQGSWIPGCLKKNDEESTKKENVNSIEIKTDQQRPGMDKIVQKEQNVPRPPSPTVVDVQPSRRGSFLSDSTFGDIPCIDVRLGLIDEDRFTDMSEAIFKKHS